MTIKFGAITGAVLLVALLAGLGGLRDWARPVVAQADPGELYEQYVDAVNAGDVEGALAVVADDAVFTTGLCAGLCVGKGPIDNFIEMLVERNSEITILDSEVSGNTATGTQEGVHDGVRAAGTGRVLASFTVEVTDGLISSLATEADREDEQTVAYYGWLGENAVVVELGPGRDAEQESSLGLLVPWNGRTQVVVHVEPGPAGVAQPIHILEGTCANLGDVRYPLQDVVNGLSLSVVDAPLSDLQGAPLAINVHQSEEEIDTYVACGDIPALETSEGLPEAGIGGAPGEGEGIAAWWYALAASGVVLVLGGLTGLALTRRWAS